VRGGSGSAPRTIERLVDAYGANGANGAKGN